MCKGARHKATIRPPRPATRPVMGHDTAPLRATIRCGAHGLSALRVNWAHHARSQGQLGVHMCTQPSFGLSALFQSLFGPLFMNTVHTIFQKK